MCSTPPSGMNSGAYPKLLRRLCESGRNGRAFRRAARRRRVVLGSALLLAARSAAFAQAERRLKPVDLFAIEELGSIVWSPHGSAAAVEFSSSERTLDPNVPSSDLRILDIPAARWRTIASRDSRYVGFFGAAWSPNGKALLFLSVDSNAVIRPWVWPGGATSPHLLRGVVLNDALADRPVGLWSDDAHVVLLAREASSANSGPIYAALSAYRNAADRWRKTYQGRVATVNVMESRGTNTVTSPRRLVSVDVRNSAVTVLARGDLHHPELSPDHKTVSYWRQNPALSAILDTTLFGRAPTEADYLRIDWGNERHAIDLSTGKEVAPPSNTASPPSATASVPAPPGPRPDAQLQASAADGVAALYSTTSDSEGTYLWLVRRGAPPLIVWKGNEWVRTVTPGRFERIAYSDSAGHSLTGWVLFPPHYRNGIRLAVVTVVYPGTLYTTTAPWELSPSLLYRDFENWQLLAALGYLVVLPSMPYPDQPLQGNMIAPLTTGVLPLLDTLVARGIADSARIALLGQSAGGYAVQAMITQTDRFRTAISTAGYSDLISLYGTFYGQYRHGDAGDLQASTALRFMQFERGYYKAGAPPWAAREQYIANSPIFRVADVHTPILIVQGENDFIPVQQSEEYFSALYRQNKRARFLRYYGEEHTIMRRANVLDFWCQLEAWLRETMN